ncbi:MAG: DinB family protein [Vicinamibacterales bacterium]
MSRADRLADLIDRVLDGDCWHGPSVVELVTGLSADAASARPIPGGHTAWELVLHMTGWADEVRARLGGAPAGTPPAGDWPPMAAPPTDAAWRGAVERLVESHRVLAAAIRGIDDQALDAPVVDHRDDAAGTGMSLYLTLHGLVHHSVYHAGQLAMLRRVLAVQP